MLLYAIYEPGAHHNNPSNRARVYAFASIERLVIALREVPGAGTGRLEMLTKHEAHGYSSIARLYTDINEDGIPKTDGDQIMVPFF